MSRKLIPLTAEISHSESLFNLTTWQRNENFAAPPTKQKRQPAGAKVKTMVTKWNGTKRAPQKADGIFSYTQNGPEDSTTKVIGII